MAFQEVPHLHIHIHPRLTDDQMLRGYPQLPVDTARRTLDGFAATLKAQLERADD